MACAAWRPPSTCPFAPWCCAPRPMAAPPPPAALAAASPRAPAPLPNGRSGATSVPLPSAPVRRLTCLKPWRWMAASCATRANTWCACTRRRCILATPGRQRRWRNACTTWPVPTRRACGACACCCPHRASPAPKPLPCSPPRCPCACNWRHAPSRPRTASSCATKPRAARTTPPLPRPRRACSTPCCGTRQARSPNAPLATSPRFWMAAGPRRRWPVACCPAWAVPWHCARAA